MPSFTFAATANAVALAGGVPVFADIDRDTFCLDPASVEAAITDRTVAIMPVHLYGHPADMPALQRLADAHGLKIFEDAAQAHGASLNGTPVGAFGSFAMFSLYPTKNMTSGEGGMVSVADDATERLMRLYRNQGMQRQYENEVVGFNNRMTDIHAAIGRVQLTKVDAWTKQRQENAAFLTSNLEGVATPPVADGAVHVYHQYTVRVPEDRDGLAAALRERVRRRFRHVLPDPQPPPRAVPGRRRTPRDRAGRARVPLAAGAPISVPRRPRAHRRRQSTRWRRQVPDGEPARGPRRHRHDGPQPRPGPAMPSKVSISSPSPIPAATSFGMAGDATVVDTVTETDRSRHRRGRRRDTDGLPPRRRPRTGRGRRAHADREAAGHRRR